MTIFVCSDIELYGGNGSLALLLGELSLLLYCCIDGVGLTGFYSYVILLCFMVWVIFFLCMLLKCIFAVCVYYANKGTD